MSKRDRASRSSSSRQDPNVSVSGCSKGKGKGRGHAWTSEEDDKLTQVIRELGLDNWSAIASRIPSRSDKSCRARWFSYLRHHVVDPEGDDASVRPVLDVYNDLICDPTTPKELREYYELLRLLYVKQQGRTYNFHVLGSPLVEISKLIIDLRPFDFDFDSVHSQRLNIYGHIILIDELGNEFLIFKKDESDPLTVTVDTLDLELQNFNYGCPRCLPASFRVLVELNLKDIHRNKFIVDKDMYVDFNATNFPHDDRSCLCWSYPIRLEGNIYRSAVLACVGVSVVQSDKVDDGDETQQEVNVGGSVVGTIQVSGTQTISRELFRSNTNGEPHIINYGIKDNLVDSGITAVAVPSHSSLVIQLHLTVAGIEEISDSVNFEADDRSGLDKKVIAGNICNVVVSVKWYHPIHSFPETVSRQWCHDDVEGKSSDYASSSSSRAVDTSNNPKIRFLSRCTRQSPSKPFYIQPHLLELKSRNWLVRVGCDELSESLIEVFCISISFFPEVRMGESLSIHGGINGYIEYGQNSVDYFKLEEMEPSYETGVGILYPHGPKRCHLSSRFAISLDLKDAEDREISYGYLTWDEFQYEGWMNRRMCSVIPGKHGYAAVHYMVIMDALQAKVKCILSSKSNDVVGCCCDIRGVIRARYSNYRYATAHDKAYYQSTLLKKSGFEHVGDDGEVPLSRCAVAVPIISGLIVSVDIELKSSDADTDADALMMRGEALFKPRMCKDSEGDTVYLPEEKLVSTVGNYSFAVYVEWEGER